MYKVDANGNISITDKDEIEMFLKYQKANPNSGYKNAYQHITNADNGFKLELDEVVITRDGKGIEQAQQSVMSTAISIGLLTGTITSPIDGPLPVAETLGFGMGVLATYAAVKSVELGISIPTSATMAYGVPSMSEANGLVFSKSSGKNERHGDGGRTQSKVEKQLQELEERLSSATGSERKKIQTKIQNIKKSAQKARRGEEHSKANKR